MGKWTPTMMDVAVAYARFRFLGDEFLTWLWYVIEEDPDLIRKVDEEMMTVEIGNRLVLENRRQKSLERITIKGDDAGLEEGMLALRKGALVAEMSIVFRSAEHEWSCNLKGESLNFSGLKTPKVALPDSPEEMDGFVLEKIYLYDKVLQLIENLYNIFVRRRISQDWSQDTIPRLKKWIG
jgi:hypothetical protein